MSQIRGMKYNIPIMYYIKLGGKFPLRDFFAVKVLIIVLPSKIALNLQFKI
jgi:hypothetical protein